MGYKPTAKHYELSFTQFPGLEVTAKGATLGEIETIQGMNISVNEKDPEKRMEIFRFFEKKLVKWNLEHPEVTGEVCADCGLAEDDPMPTTVRSMLCLEADMILQIVIGWVFAIARASLPKEMNLSSGGKTGPLNTPQELTEELMRQLEKAQNLMPSNGPSFT